MKLKNKKTEEIRLAEAREDGIYLYDESTEQWYKYELPLLAEYWGYYEEPKEYWYIDAGGNVMRCLRNDEYDNEAKEIGNYFLTKEEAEKAVENLKAWKRLKDDGFKFDGWFRRGNGADIIYCDFGIADTSLLNLLFRGEE